MAPAAPQPPGAVPPPMAPPPGAAPHTTLPPPGMTRQPGMPAAARYPVQKAARPGATKSSGAQIWGGIGLAAMLLAAICSFLPWANVFLSSASGWELGSDAKISFGLAIAAGAFFLVGLITRARWPFVIGLIITIITGAVFIIDLVDVMDTFSSSHVGFGLYVGIAAAALGLVAAIGGIAAKRQ